MRRNWKVILSAAAVSCMVLSLAACGGGNEDLVTDAGKDTSDENVKLVFLRAGTEDYKKDAFTQMIEGFEAKYPNYTVEYQEAPWGDDFETKLNTGFASGTHRTSFTTPCHRSVREYPWDSMSASTRMPKAGRAWKICMTA